jgi:hypothetical protein
MIDVSQYELVGSETPLRIRALSVGSHVPNLTGNRSLTGKIHSCFSNSINVLFPEDQIVNIADRRRATSGPLNIVLDVPSGMSLASFHLKPGEPVHANGESLELCPYLTITTISAEVYRSKHELCPPSQSLRHIERSVLRLESIVQRLGRFESGLRSLLGSFDGCNDGKAIPFGEPICSGVSSLLSSTDEKNLEGISRSAHALVGMGPGLTPSADDLLCGYMLACYLFMENLGGDLKFVGRMNEAILGQSGQTTVISRNYLRLAAGGDGTKPCVSVIERLLADDSDHNDLERTAVDLLSIGATSGTDTAIGIILGSKLALKILAEN